MSNRLKNFITEKHYANGTKEKPELHKIDEMDFTCRMGRRGFLHSTAIGIAAIKLAGKNLFAEDKKDIMFQGTYSGDCSEAVLAHGGTIEAIRFLPGMKHIVSVSNSTSPYEISIRFWEYPGRKLVKALTFHELFTGDPFHVEGIGKVKTAIESLVPAELRDSDDYKKTVNIVLGESELTHWSYDYKIEKHVRLYSLKRHIEICRYAKKVVILDATEDKPLHTITFKSLSSKKNKFFTFELAAIDRDERLLALLDNLINTRLLMWDLKNKKIVALKNFEYNRISSMEFSNDGKLIYAGFNDGFIRVMKTDTLEIIQEIGIKNKKFQRHSIKLSDKGDLIASSCTDYWDKALMISEIPSGKILYNSKEHSSVFEFTPDSEYIAWSNGAKLNIGESRNPDIRACFFDPAVLDKYKSVNQYQISDSNGNVSTFVSSSKTLPKEAVCVCNAVNGTYEDRIKSRSGGGGGGCSCNRVCTCVPVK